MKTLRNITNIILGLIDCFCIVSGIVLIDYIFSSEPNPDAMIIFAIGILLFAYGTNELVKLMKHLSKENKI